MPVLTIGEYPGYKAPDAAQKTLNFNSKSITAEAIG